MNWCSNKFFSLLFIKFLNLFAPSDANFPLEKKTEALFRLLIHMYMLSRLTAVSPSGTVYIALSIYFYFSFLFLFSSLLTGILSFLYFLRKMYPFRFYFLLSLYLSLFLCAITFSPFNLQFHPSFCLTLSYFFLSLGDTGCVLVFNHPFSISPVPTT